MVRMRRNDALRVGFAVAHLSQVGWARYFGFGTAVQEAWRQLHGVMAYTGLSAHDSAFALGLVWHHRFVSGGGVRPFRH